MTFSPEWLRLREPVDARSRDPESLRALVDWIANGRLGDVVHVVDFGSGTASNLRFLAPLISSSQSWTLVDHDPVLIRTAFETTAVWAAARGWTPEYSSDGLVLGRPAGSISVRSLTADLGRGLHDVPVGRSLVTASALLDLVSAGWIDALVERCAKERSPLHFALTYDGRSICEPFHSGDATVLDLFNRHQLRDKGFGSALGPGAATYVTEQLVRKRYAVSVSPSDWILGPGDDRLQRSLIDGWFAAALEVDAAAQPWLESWRDARLRHIDDGVSRLTVGHVDLTARPESAG